MKPINSRVIAYHLVFSHFFVSVVTVNNIATTHITTVLVTSINDLKLKKINYLANDEIYFVTETPQILNVAIVNIPNMI